jgi:hypothetical protein
VDPQSIGGVRSWGTVRPNDCLPKELPKEGGGVRLRICDPPSEPLLLLGELTVVVVNRRRVPIDGVTTVVVGGMMLTDAAEGTYDVVTEGMKDALVGITLTDAPGDMQAEPPTGMVADAPSYTIHVPRGEPGRNRGGVTERAARRCCCLR